MLIRIVDHFRDNPKRVDKLIAIKGLPESWFFEETPAGKLLKKPWMPDVDANIPKDIREFCEPMYMIFRYSPIQPNAGEVTEKRMVLGVKIDFNSEPGREMWERVERYIEESTPRDERIPVPVLCAKDERSAFETYTPRRRPGSGGRLGSLELHPSPVPTVDLDQYKKKEVFENPVIPQPEPVKPALNGKRVYACPDCDSVFDKARAITMHAMKKHPKGQKVGV